MTSEQEKREALQRILKSKTFSKATTTNVLLKLLMDATLAQKEISAVTIGMELFGKKYDPEKSDVNIRVNISHLRKRLKQYYAEEGQDDPVRITIAPGQYRATFSRPKKNSPALNKWTISAVTVLVLIGVLVVVYLLASPDEGVWTPAIDGEPETTLYIGDVFGYRGPGAFGAFEWHRDARINSTEEFYELINKAPETYSGLEPGGYSYVVYENSAIVKPFTRYFTQRGYDFSLQPSSGFSTKLIREQSTVYAGPVYVQVKFVELFNQLAKNVQLQVQTLPHGVFKLSYVTEGDTTMLNLNGSGAESEYALIGAFDGPNSTRHYMFFANHGMGLTALVDYFTQPETLEAFTAEHLQESSEFVAVFFVKGQNRTNVNMELRYLDDNR